MVKKIKIVRTDRELECPHLDKTLQASGADLVLLPHDISENLLAEEVREADLLLTCYTPVTSRIIKLATKLKAIIKYGVGIDAIDITAAKSLHIPVVNIPEYAEETVAEAAFAIMIALAKKLLSIHKSMESQGWVWPTSQWIGNDIAGKTVGLIGVGRIGQCMARMSRSGFRTKVLGYDPNVSTDSMLAVGIEKQEHLQRMLRECDFVSIHCVLNDNTHKLVGDAEFQCMKPTAFLINTARGAIVDELALLRALKNKQIAGAGLDVFSQEPLAKLDHPLNELYGMENVILLPHLAFYTRESLQRLEEETIERCFEALENRVVYVKSKDPRLISQKNGISLEPLKH